MESRLKFFKIFLVITISLDAVLSILNYYLLTKYVPQFSNDWSILMLLSSLVFFLIASVFVLLLLKKYPSQPISNTTEGLVFTFAIITFLFAFLDLFPIYLLVEIAFVFQEKNENAIASSLLFVSLSSVITIACAIFIAINSFRLLKIIRRNRGKIAQQIKNIGTDYE